MFFNQMGHFMPITYLPPTSHLQFYYLPTHPFAYLLTHPPTYLITYSPTNYLPTHKHPPTYLIQPTYFHTS
jgi:hypothetical protein